MGSNSDLATMRPAIDLLREFGLGCTVRVLSAHRSPDKTLEFAKNAKENGCEVLIAAAGGAAHLAGMLAAVSELPVIGVPLVASSLGGMDALLSTLQMPPGVPVATMGLGEWGGTNAALFAVRILALHDDVLLKRLRSYQERQRVRVDEQQEDVSRRLTD